MINNNIIYSKSVTIFTPAAALSTICRYKKSFYITPSKISTIYKNTFVKIQIIMFTESTELFR